MKNAIISRIKATKTGKLIRRKMGLDHCRAKKSSRQLLRKYEPASFSKPDRKVFIKKYGVLNS